MRLKTSFFLFLSVLLFVVAGMSCRKTLTLNTGGVLKFSVDTVKFDTVFTAAGSFTYQFVIYNPQNEQINISSVRMQNGTSSFFHLNVDGQVANPGGAATNLKIAPHDSIYVFATININPNNATNPFLITDSMVATLNGGQFIVPFTAYGQNARYITGDSLTATTNWDTVLPYVVIHNLVVGPGVTFNIPAHCKVYMHQDGEIIVYGTLNINASATTATGATDSTVFQGDRLDRSYFSYMGYPGEWCGIWFLPGSNGVISHSVFKNCGGGTSYYNYYMQPAAVQLSPGARLAIDHSIIENSLTLGLLSDSGIVTATDCLFNTTGGEAFAVIQGGVDTITNCTFANYGTQLVNHANAVTAVIQNWFTPDNVNFYYGALSAVMRNCIVYGSLDTEIACDTSAYAHAAASIIMDHCLLKMGDTLERFISFSDCIFNKDPMFSNSANGDFHLGTGSPAKAAGVGSPFTGLTAITNNTDLDGNQWGDSIAIGCYKE